MIELKFVANTNEELRALRPILEALIALDGAPQPQAPKATPEPQPVAEVAPEPAPEPEPKRGRRKKSEEPEIRANPENRVDPEAEAVEEQDAADEAAEIALPARPLTHDDVRQALGDYVKAYGMAAAQQDGPKLIERILGPGNVKVSDIPDDPDALSRVVAGVQEMIASNPHGRKANG